jgi:hypothetical protein
MPPWQSPRQFSALAGAAYIVHPEEGLQSCSRPATLPSSRQVPARFRCLGCSEVRALLSCGALITPYHVICVSDTARQLNCVVLDPCHHRQDQMYWLSGSFSLDLPSPLRGHYMELRISPKGAAGLPLLMPVGAGYSATLADLG